MKNISEKATRVGKISSRHSSLYMRRQFYTNAS